MTMLAACFIALRFVHFSALMLAFGCTVSSAMLTPYGLRPRLTQRLRVVWLPSVWLTAISAFLLLAAQAGMMGNGWQDTVSPQTWAAVLSTGFGSLWLWQLILSATSLGVLALAQARQQAGLLWLTLGQLILLAGVGHAAMQDGLFGFLQRANHAVHLVSAAWWAGGLVPLVVCMRLAGHQQYRDAAIIAMMRFSRYGHLAVAAVIITGIINAFMIIGWHLPLGSRYLQLLLIKSALVALMVILAVINRYLLVPRFNRHSMARQRFIQFTWLEVILSTAVLILVSLFATLEPF